jgi:predicted metal-dependent enzyme (double-stranded beta helix superfamily)
MDFDSYVQQTLATLDGNAGDEKKTALQVRALTQRALAQESFVMSCAERVVTLIEESKAAWRNPPLYGGPEDRISVRVFYWSPGFQNDPHLHSSWTVTGVLHNCIVAETFRGAASVAEVDLEQSQKYTAQAGMAGYLLPPCVHRLINTSERETATLHVFSAEPRQQAGAEPIPIAAAVTASQQPIPALRDARRRALNVMVQMLAAIKGLAPLGLLERIFAIGDNTIKLQVVKTLASRDIGLAYSRGRELETRLRGDDQVALGRINAELAKLCGQFGAAS